MAGYVVASLDLSEDSPGPKWAISLERRLLEQFCLYATEDVPYTEPNSPPFGMTFAALGYFFVDSMALGDMSATGQQRFIERIAPPLGRHITWSDFKIIIALVAEKRFPREPQEEALHKAVEDMLLNLQLASSTTSSRRGGLKPTVRPDDLYADAEVMILEEETEQQKNRSSLPANDDQHQRYRESESSSNNNLIFSNPSSTSLSPSRGASKDSLSSSAFAEQRDGRGVAAAAGAAVRRLSSGSAAAPVRAADSSRSASKVSFAASDVTATTASKRSSSPLTKRRENGGLKKPRSRSGGGGVAGTPPASPPLYMPRGIHVLVSPVFNFLKAGRSGEELCLCMKLPVAACGPLDCLSRDDASVADWSPAQLLWRAVGQLAPILFPASSAVAAEELAFQLLLDRVSMIA